MAAKSAVFQANRRIIRRYSAAHILTKIKYRVAPRKPYLSDALPYGFRHKKTWLTI